MRKPSRNKLFPTVFSLIFLISLFGMNPGPAAAANPAVTVSVSGGELNILATSDAPLGTQVDYVVATDKWKVIDSFATPGSNCEEESSAVVVCPESGEDVDVDFGNVGGSVTMALADINLDFDSNITLGNGSDNVTAASEGDDIVALPGAPSATVNGDDINTLDGDDQITTGNGSDIIDGGDDGDTIVANGGNNFINGGEFAGDTSGDTADVLTGGPLTDEIDGGAGGDTITGGGGATDPDDDDVLNGSTGIDVINAGGGEDEVDGGNDGDTIDAGDGNDVDITGGSGDDTVSGGPGNDTLDGGANTDTLHGDGGDDTLLNSDGADTFHGEGNGSAGDTVDYSPTTAASSMTISIDGLVGDGRNCPGASCENDNVQTTVENVTGDSSADKIIGSSGPNVLNGGTGDDTLSGGPGPGGDGADRFIGGGNGTPGDTVTYAGRTSGLTVDIDGAADDAGESDDVELDVENLTGGSGADTLTGSSSGNALNGGAGTANDVLNGLGGNDTLRGGDGTNTGADGADTFNGGANTDTVSYSTRTGSITADLDGVVGDDTDGDTNGADVENLTGGTNMDTLTGNNLPNVLDGGAANDTLAGGASSGADGADTFIGGPSIFSGDTVTYAARADVISADIDATIGDDTGGDTVSADVENLTGGSAGDTLTGDLDENILKGGPGTGSDILSGLGEDDDFFGGTGTNTGPDGADTFIAGTQGSDGDLVSYASRTDSITASIGGTLDSDGDDVQSAIDNLTGGSGNDTLIGDLDPNHFVGGAGSDTMQGGASAGADSSDRFSGGSDGTTGDTVSYANRSEDVDADLDGIDDDGDATNCPGIGCEADDILSDVENLTGGTGDDDLGGDNDTNVLNGGDGDDDIITSTSSGPDGADTYIGGTNGTVGGQNNNRGDRLFYFNRSDPLTIDIGGGANDTDGDDVRGDIETVWGGEANDSLTGDGDNNQLDGREGDDIIRGGTGPGPDGTDDLHGGIGTDTVTYATRTDDLTFDLGIQLGPDGDTVAFSLETVISGSGDDSITGDPGANTLKGGPGQDDLFGLAGADTLLVRDGGPDTADCGDDIDTVTADEPITDTLTDCENADTLPNTRITQRPNDRITVRSVTYKFRSDQATLFQCRLDGAAFTSCTSPKTFNNLSLGRHTFRVRAVDADGDKDPTPAIDRFRRVRP